MIRVVNTDGVILQVIVSRGVERVGQVLREPVGELPCHIEDILWGSEIELSGLDLVEDDQEEEEDTKEID